MITDKQRNTINVLLEKFHSNCNKYVSWGSSKYCNFGVFKSSIEGDENVTVVMTLITSISDNGQPFTETDNILIEPSGNQMDLMEVYPENDVVGYLEKLHKIEY